MKFDDYKKGLIDASMIYEKKNNQLSEELDILNNNLDEFSTITDELIDIAEENDLKLNQLEYDFTFGQDRFFQLNTIPNELKPLIYRWIFSALKESFVGDLIPSEHQQHYLITLREFLDIKTANQSVELHAIANIQDISIHQFLANTYLELIYLEKLDFSDDQAIYKPLSFLHVSDHFINTSQTIIKENVKFEGIDTLTNRYKVQKNNHIEKQLINTDQPNTDDLVYETINKPTNLSLVSNSIYYTYFLINDSISITENIHFAYCTFEFESDLSNTFTLNKSVDVTFENCIFKVKTPAFDSVFNISQANITFSSCHFEKIIDQYNENHINNGFFKLEQGSLNVQNCRISNSTGTIFNLSNCESVNINSLEITNHVGNTFEISNIENIVIENSTFLNISEDKQDKAFIQFTNTKLTLNSCIFNNQYLSSELALFSGANSHLSVSYCNFSSSIEGKKDYILKNPFKVDIKILNSEFYHCYGFEGNILHEDTYYIENTTFYSCEGTLITSKNFIITNCVFDQCLNSNPAYEFLDLNYVKKEDNEFMYRAEDKLGAFIATRGTISDKACIIENSIFRNCQSNTLVSAHFQCCDFKNNRVIENTTNYLPLQGRIKQTNCIFNKNTIIKANISIIAELYIKRIYSISPENGKLYKQLSDKVIKNAKNKFALLDRNIDIPIIALIDTTLFNTGKAGISLSTRNISFSNLFSKPYIIQYKELQDVTVILDKKENPYSSSLLIKTITKNYTYTELSLDKTELEGMLRDIMLYQLL